MSNDYKEFMRNGWSYPAQMGNGCFKELKEVRFLLSKDTVNYTSWSYLPEGFTSDNTYVLSYMVEGKNVPSASAFYFKIEDGKIMAKQTTSSYYDCTIHVILGRC